MSVSYNFSGKVALITGSSSGIGAGTAILFAKSGADVVITGRNAENLSDVAKQCQKASDNKARVLQVVADISKEEDIQRLVKSTIDKFGKLDILVNNAGIAGSAYFTDTNYISNHKSVSQTNVDSVLYLTHLCVEYLAKTKGNIINTSSVAGVIAFRRLSSYCMSKSALNMFTRCMAAELGDKGIRVNSLNVGAVRTPIKDKMGMPKEETKDLWEKHASVYPVGRAGEPEDIANTILFLASDSASFITGANIADDGGHLAANIDLYNIK